MEAEQVEAAAEEVVEQVELADDIQQVEQFGGGTEKDEIVAATVAADKPIETERAPVC